MPEMRANSADVNELLKAVDGTSGTPRNRDEGKEKKLGVVLEDRELWSKFKQLTNEMIVTKSGRRMFPVIRVSISGLDPSAMYSVLVDFGPVDQQRWKYMNGDWVSGGKAEPSRTPTVYVHPDSPNFGSHWMKEPVSFSKVKLTNKMHGTGQVVLNSLHKYQPRVHILRVGEGVQKTVASHSYPETQFVAVTAYQNEEITALKIKYNPFAKAFQDAKERPDQRESNGCDDLPENDHKRLSHVTHSWFLPPPAHQFPNSLTIPCNPRFNLRDYRHTPYTQPYPRASPPHATYSHEFNPNIPVVNLPDNWTRPSSHLLASSASSHQGQYAMWNHHLTAGSPQQASPSPYPAFLRSPASYALPPTPESLPDTSQLYYETPLTSGQGHVDAATASLVSSFQSALVKSSTSTWNPLTPSSI
ncbi:hypothetical protein NP493_14g01019 [Ridgeia piscesae]|uniref:T-box domain-containing protein n=1 Tax=Ridgeia piscesae TaxID=27915 RepID=A0AAD9PE67_RIDPI|nr:hypothetical protein NP493_14g01019 [Ridgeia piscesae]